MMTHYIMTRNYSHHSSRNNNSSNDNKSTLSPSNYLLSPVGNTVYLPLTNDDLIYNGNLNRCKDPEFKLIISKITRDLNMLLHFKDQDFWIQVQQSASLRKCLESCLQIFPKKSYGMYFDKQSKVVQSDKVNKIQLQSHRTFSQLMRIVLFIYHRMAQNSSRQKRQITYNQWILDIPKMLNIIRVYKESNPKIVEFIINQTFKNIPSYIDDVGDFISIVKDIVIDALFLDLKFQFKENVIRESSNFSNPMLSFTRNLIKSFYRIFDVYSTLIDYVENFPACHVILLICQQDLLIDLIDGYFQYVENIGGKWQLTKEFKMVFKAFAEGVRQKMIEFFIKILDMLDSILKKQVAKQNWNKCLKVYFCICKQFAQRNNSPRGPLWQSLINILIIESPNRQFFRIQKFFEKKLTPQQIQLIKKCRIYEQQYIKITRFKQFNKQEILQFKLNSIKSMKQWEDFYNYPSFDQMKQSQINFDQTVYDDSILHLMEKQFVKKKYNKHIDPSKFNLYDQKTIKKKLQYPYFKDEEYNDQPTQFDEIDDLECFSLIGRQPIYQVYNNQDLQNFDEKHYQTNKNSNNDGFWGKKFAKYNMAQNYSYYYNKDDHYENSPNPKNKKKRYIAADELTIQNQKNESNIIANNNYTISNNNLQNEKQKSIKQSKQSKIQSKSKNKQSNSQSQKKYQIINQLSFSISQQKYINDNTFALTKAIQQANQSIDIIFKKKDNHIEQSKNYDENDSELIDIINCFGKSDDYQQSIQKQFENNSNTINQKQIDPSIKSNVNDNQPNLSFELQNNPSSLTIAQQKKQQDNISNNKKKSKIIKYRQVLNNEDYDINIRKDRNGRNKKFNSQKNEKQYEFSKTNNNNQNKYVKKIYNQKW